jgi:hypothetical protein
MLLGGNTLFAVEYESATLSNYKHFEGEEQQQRKDCTR